MVSYCRKERSNESRNLVEPAFLGPPFLSLWDKSCFSVYSNFCLRELWCAREVLVTSVRPCAGVNLPFHLVSDELHSSGN